MDLIDNSNISSIEEKTYTNENGEKVIEKIIYIKTSSATATAQRRGRRGQDQAVVSTGEFCNAAPNSLFHLRKCLLRLLTRCILRKGQVRQSRYW